MAANIVQTLLLEDSSPTARPSKIFQRFLIEFRRYFKDIPKIFKEFQPNGKTFKDGVDRKCKYRENVPE